MNDETRQLKRGEGRAKLLDAALMVIREKGYTDSTVDDLCREAGVTKGAFFHHFKSKEELAVAAAGHFGAAPKRPAAIAPKCAAAATARSSFDLK